MRGDALSFQRPALLFCPLTDSWGAFPGLWQKKKKKSPFVAGAAPVFRYSGFLKETRMLGVRQD